MKYTIQEDQVGGASSGYICEDLVIVSYLCALVVWRCDRPHAISDVKITLTSSSQCCGLAHALGQNCAPETPTMERMARSQARQTDRCMYEGTCT